MKKNRRKSSRRRRAVAKRKVMRKRKNPGRSYKRRFKSYKRRYNLAKRMNPAKKKRATKRRKRVTGLKKFTKKIFSKNIFMNSILLLAGIGGAGSLKAFTARMMPEGLVKTTYQRGFGVLAIAAGFFVGSMSKRKETKTLSTGMAAFGVYDLIVSNVPMLSAYLPSIQAPTAFTDNMSGGYQAYGRSVMGAGFSKADPSSTEIVGAANISAGVVPEIVGAEHDLADMLDMGC